MSVFQDLTGCKFDKLTVQNLSENLTSYGLVLWKCICECGNLVKVAADQLTNKPTGVRSCGCLAKESAKKLMTTHGMHKTPTYKSWVSMKERCSNPNNDSYVYYGGCGIIVCERWLNSFENFYEDMGVRPENMTLDRIDTDNNYEPDNCRWATIHDQANNRRNNVIINHECINYTRGQLAKKYNIPTHVLTGRLRNNWSFNDIIKKPIAKSNYVNKKFNKGKK